MTTLRRRCPLRMCGAAVPLLLCLAATARASTLANVDAQDTRTRADTVRFLIPAPDSTQLPQPIDATLVPSLRQAIALELHGVTRERALAEIGRAAGLSIVYASELLPPAGSLDLTNRAISVRAAIETALAGLSLDVLVADHGTVILLSRPRPAVTEVGGIVLDSISRTPVRLAAIRVTGTAETVLSDDAGRFHLAANPGPLELSVHRIGFQPTSLRVIAGQGATNTRVSLARAPLELDAVVVEADRRGRHSSAAEEQARRIITAAIARRTSNRAGLHDYRYDAHVLLVERNPNGPVDSASSITVMQESVVKGYWQAPDRVQQTIVARRRVFPANGISFEFNIGLLRVEDFDEDRWSVFGIPDTPVASPIADGALAHYAYSVLDTLTVAGHRVFRLSIEPTSQTTPAFDGIVDITDSTFDVVALDVGVNHVTGDMFAVQNLQVRLRFADVGGGRWMPVSIGTTLRGSLFRLLPAESEYVATLDNFRFNGAPPPAGLGEYPVVVASGADQADRSVFAGAPSVQLTPAEAQTLAQSDSASAAPAGGSRIHFTIASQYLDDLRFNRVDGWRYGFGGTWDKPAAAPWMTPTAKLGYEFGAKRWTYDVGDQILLSPVNRLSIGAQYHDETLATPVFASENYNPTVGALLAGAGADALDYYRERGLVASLSTRLFDLTQLSVAYTNGRQSSLSVLPRYATPGGGWLGLTPQPNAPIADGRLHSLSAEITYDSRPMVLEPHAYERLDYLGIGSEISFTRISLQTEVSAPTMFGGDFDYRRYLLRIERLNERWGLGTTDLTAVGGIAVGNLPPQRYFDVNGGASLPSHDAPFSTLGESVYGGNRAAAVIVEHHFVPSLLSRSAISGIRELPLELAVHAAAFWSTFNGTPAITARNGGFGSAPSAYGETGFTIGYRSSSLPLDLAIRVSRQLSSYPTRGTRVTIGFWN